MAIRSVSSQRLSTRRLNTSDLVIPVYSITPSTFSCNEGDVVTYAVSTYGVNTTTNLYWTNSGTTTATDFTGNVNSGVFTVAANGASVIPFTLAADQTTEGQETVIINLRTSSNTGPIVATAGTVIVGDTSITPAYSITPSVSTVNEGSSITFTVNTTQWPNGSTLYYTLSGVTSADITGGVLSGSFTITNNVGSIPISIAADNTTEGTEILGIDIRIASITGPVVATSQANIADTSTFQPTTTTYSTAGTYTFTATPGTYTIKIWGAGGGGAPKSNPGGGAGAVLVSNVSATISQNWTVYVASGGDRVTGDADTGNSIRGVGGGGYGGGGSGAGSSSGSTTWAGAGGGGSSAVTGSAAGTLIAAGGGGGAGDIGGGGGAGGSGGGGGGSAGGSGSSGNPGSNGGGGGGGSNLRNQSSGSGGAGGSNSAGPGTSYSGSGTGAGNSGDANYIAGRGSGGGGGYNAGAGTQGLVVIVKTAELASYTITSNVATVTEGNTVAFTVTGANGTLYWTNNGGTTGADFTDGLNEGTVVISGGTGTFTRTLVWDMLTEGTETIGMNIRTGSNVGSVVAATTVSVTDSSITPTYNISANIAGSYMYETDTIRFTVNTTSILNGYTLYYTIAGNISAGDLSSGSLSGSFTVNNNQGTVHIQPISDASDPYETLQLQIRTGSTSGTIVASSGTYSVLEYAAYPTSFSYMVLGGGGGGGGYGGGGGGGGGYIFTSSALSAGTNFPVTVGAGGSGGTNGTTGGAGSPSTFNGLTAVGGGGGGSNWNSPTPGPAGASGGSGGGGSGTSNVLNNGGSGGSGTAGQGNSGGSGSNSGTNPGSPLGGGGGGAGGGGYNGNQFYNEGGQGGIGATNTLLAAIPYGSYNAGTGPHVVAGSYTGYYVGGGGGGRTAKFGAAPNYDPVGGWAIHGGGSGCRLGPNSIADAPGGSGGGGGAGGFGNATSAGGDGQGSYGGPGGSGAVIIGYSGKQVATGGSVTQKNGMTYHVFTSSGNFTTL